MMMHEPLAFGRLRGKLARNAPLARHTTWRVGGSAVFFAAVAAQALVIVMYFSLNIGYLWYNLIGCAACIGFSVVLQAALPARAPGDGEAG